jgi:hypothetical protein
VCGEERDEEVLLLLLLLLLWWWGGCGGGAVAVLAGTEHGTVCACERGRGRGRGMAARPHGAQLAASSRRLQSPVTSWFRSLSLSALSLSALAPPPLPSSLVAHASAHTRAAFGDSDR